MTELGIYTISTQEKDFIFKPSFKNIGKLGDGKSIVEKFAILHGLYEQPLINEIETLENDARSGALIDQITSHLNKVRSTETLPVAIEVMQCCLTNQTIDDLDELTGFYIARKARYRGNTLVSDGRIEYVTGALDTEQMISFAQGLMQHGIMGKAKIRTPIRDKKEAETTDDLKLFDYITSARMNLELPLDEAEDLTMTEFQYMIDAKFGHNKKGFTDEEHDQLIQEERQRREDIANGKIKQVTSLKGSDAMSAIKELLR